MKSSNMWWLLAIVVVIGVVAVMSGSQSFAVFTEEPVWRPQYLSAECVTRANHLSETSLGTIDRRGEFYTCKTGSGGTYIPPVDGVQCEFLVDRDLAVNSYVCDGTTDDDDLDTSACDKVDGFFSAVDEEIQYTINEGESLYIDPINLLGSASIKARYPSYGLQVETSDGRVLSTTNTCELNSLNKEYHPLDDASVVAPDVPFNVVQGLSPARTVQVGSFEDVAGGALVYITRPGYYYPVAEAKDGFLFVDTRVDEQADSDIECIPRSTGCSDEAKIIPLDGQPADEFGGAVSGYAPVAGDTSKVCRYAVADGVLKLTSDCIEVAKCDGLTQWDTETGECLSVDPDPEDKASLDLQAIIIALVIVVLAILTVLAIKVRRGGKK